MIQPSARLIYLSTLIRTFAGCFRALKTSLMPFQDDLSSPIYDDAGNITGFGQQSTYTPYQGERIAPSSMYGDIQGSRAMVRGIAQSGYRWYA